MSPRAGYSPSGTQHPSTHQTKNVDAAPQAQGFSGLDFSRLGHVGDGFRRAALRKKSAAVAALTAESAKEARIADRLPSPRQRKKAAEARAKAEAARAELDTLFEGGGGDGGRPVAPAPLSPDDILAADLANLDREEKGWQEWERHKPDVSPEIGPAEFVPPKIPEEERKPSRVAEMLPPELRPYLERMPAPRRREREGWIVKKVGWDGLEILGLSPEALAAHAAGKAREYAKRWPRKDDAGNLINQEPDHRRGRDEKIQRKRARKAQDEAVLYVEAAIGAVGGKKVPKRPLHVSDYNLLRHKQHKRRTKLTLADLWLLCADDPLLKIPMLDVDERARAAKAAERRTLIDMMLYRWKMLGWSVCWITITLPGQYVPHSTNEERRVTEWDPDLGPLEAMKAIQEDFHRVMCMLRERGIRPSGFWNAQPQQSGTPHRHILVAVPTIEDARAVCDQFRKEFGTRKSDEDGPDRGCNASVIGDDDPRYRTRKGRNNEDETPASVAKYSARYSTRQADDGDGDDVTGGGEHERAEAWRRPRHARGHTWLGLDSQRSPIELWRTLWANAQRSDYQPDDTRMALAMSHMRRLKEYTETAVAAREAAEEFPEGDEDREAELDVAREAAEQAAREAWHASIALGMWPDADLDPVELEWLRGETEGGDVDDPLPPMPLREARETVYGETRNAFVGAVGTVQRFRLSGWETAKELLPIAKELGVTVETPESGKIRARHVKKALKAAGFGFSRRPDGTVAGFDTSGEILLKTEHKWLIVDTEMAKAMAVGAQTAKWQEKRRKEEEARCTPMGEDSDSTGEERKERMASLSDSPSDPRMRGCAPPHGDERPPG